MTNNKQLNNTSLIWPTLAIVTFLGLVIALATTAEGATNPAAIVAILFAGTALVRTLPDAYIWWRTTAG